MVDLGVSEPAILACDVTEWFGQGPGYGPEPAVLPDGWWLGQVSGVTSHPDGEVYIFQRGRAADPLIVYDRAGTYLRSWGRQLVGEAHGLRMDAHGDVWATDTTHHQVYRFSRSGELLLSLGRRGVAGADERSFNMPTDIAFGPDDTVYVSDGYGNSRVVKLTREGRYVGAWGRPGTKPGEFDTPHSLAVDPAGLVYVSDRANQRIQVFDADGAYQFEWTHIGSTNGITITPDGDCWAVTASLRSYDGTLRLAGWQVMQLELPTGRILGSFECPGHMVERTAWGDVFVAALAGNVFQWTPG